MAAGGCCLFRPNQSLAVLDFFFYYCVIKINLLLCFPAAIAWPLSAPLLYTHIVAVRAASVEASLCARRLCR
ncbi:hypothetical protein COCSUDRAFT_34571 [Coccomyxa subellipsoidea C-169]|uniref:Uncharacterized protein n=1 Tax=Coccomyxa subellipsoidea (strain C-169) TaxID=574566 RepID=I0YJ60_COCSC|nr:hypothetical protein COCSUDRAFT_34571 [Coccomyxa subellipsoidea C-169]EIE18429.1 hypothetical protein COCSUDRAFT_34571 [Coccomyxa subellipsoidea C-169]|eukprot:XP_005642973.1 hypothetical protein COCSUDRAFT_34571 [Coccomyxa subellipsoidea C-169]